MESLLIKSDARKRWYPQPIETYKMSNKIPYDTPENRRLNSNFAYSMQYIEYLEKQLAEFTLSEVLKKMVYKSYIITGMGIVELLLVYLLRSTGHWNTTEWEELCEISANPKKVDGEMVKVVTTMHRKVEPYDMRMDLDSMIKKAEKKRVLTIDHNVFPALKKLRELRNRVHLQSGEGALDHDYNCIGLDEIQMMRRILYAVLMAPEICNRAATFEFINESYVKFKT